jgi:adenylate cyclase
MACAMDGEQGGLPESPTTRIGTEAERRFLVDRARLAPLLDLSEGELLRQAYLAADPVRRVRVRISDRGYALLTVKGPAGPDGLTRPEIETPIDPLAAEAMLALRHGRVIEKVRHRLPFAGRVWEVDVFRAELAGLVIAEVELTDPTARVELPPWIGVEVTRLPETGNYGLATASPAALRRTLQLLSPLHPHNGRLRHLETGWRAVA